ncbi:exosome complex component RRP43-like protein [Catenaria anguillulae PL171]|uniref:Ribosomal RNA-processing protein 43 n=1 Tax=Catenaria anguillulae PL171 TaxID=765915 RepID=A0A1Y2HCC8_9FUNG|nr:exosome complex component RRP43-like protein [Catenaria anguillulae PL171]
MIQITASSIQRLHPREYLRRFLDQGVRPDARTLADSRDVSVVMGGVHSANGSCLVKLGNTSVLCVVKAEITIPTVQHPDRGMFVPNIDLPPLCSSKFKPGPPSAEAQTLSHFVHDLVQRSPIVDLESLCIEEGKAAWVVYADMTCLSHDGNVLDAAMIALVGALRNARLPKAILDENAVRAPEERTELLKIVRAPLASTFISFDGHILADPTADEQDLMDQSTTVVVDGLNIEGPLLSMYKAGGTPLKLDQLKSLVIQAQQRAEQVMSLV